MKTRQIPAVVTIAGVLAIVSSTALPAPDKYTVKVPDGLALSEVKGYATWELVSASHAVGGEGMSYDAATGGFTPDGTGAKCGAACHTIVKAKDYVFTRYEKK